MHYEIRTILNESDLINCPTFYLDKYNWGGDYRPVTYGKMAYWKGKEFIIQMTCEETNPLRTFVNNEDPVFQDSAMEAFLDFAPNSGQGTYVNIEMNANGAVLHRFGQKPPGRKTYTEFTTTTCTYLAQISEASWSIEIHIPLPYVKDLFGKDAFEAGDHIRCNFYKLCGSKLPAEHYGSYTKINNPTWNFHLPEYFADAIII
ncbi:MAG: carbohydrate-binding family 9-like protein [Mobilitalea sp.]